MKVQQEQERFNVEGPGAGCSVPGSVSPGPSRSLSRVVVVEV